MAFSQNNTTRLPANQFPYDHALRMKQTLPSILPNILIAAIIKEADGGLGVHTRKFKGVLSNITQLEPYEWRQWLEKPAFDHEPMEPPSLFPPVCMVNKASGNLRKRDYDEIEIQQIDWWCPGGGSEGSPLGMGSGASEWYETRFHSYQFPGNRTIQA